MPYSLNPANEADFVELMRVFWTAFENPFQGFLRAVAPIANNDYEGSLRAYAAGEWAATEKDPEAEWLKVVDDASGRIVGGAKWMFHRNNPFADAAEKPFEATWYPAGGGRRYVTACVTGVLMPRFMRAQRPHAFLHIAFVLPEYRRQGISKKLTAYGVEKADELGLETWVDSSELARGLYQQYGFVFVSQQSIKPEEPEGLSETEKTEWAQTRDLVEPVQTATLWRPKGGEYVEGVTVKPWEEGQA